MPFGTTPVQSQEYTLYATTPQIKNQSRRWGGREKVYIGTYAASALAKGAQIAMVRVPKGELIIDGRLFWSALGASTQILGVGDSFICTRFMRLANGVVASDLQVGVTPFGGVCGLFNKVDALTAPLKLDGAADYSNYNGVPYETTCDTDLLVYMSYAAASTGALKLIVKTVASGD